MLAGLSPLMLYQTGLNLHEGVTQTMGLICAVAAMERTNEERRTPSEAPRKGAPQQPKADRPEPRKPEHEEPQAPQPDRGVAPGITG